MLLQRLHARFERASGCTLSVDGSGRFVALGGTRSILIVALEWPWEPRRTLLVRDLTGGVRAMEWQRGDGRSIACAGGCGTIQLYDVDTASAARAPLLTLSSGAAAHSQPAAAAAAAATAALGWRPDAPQTLASLYEDGAVALWDVRTQSRVLLLSECASVRSAVGRIRMALDEGDHEGSTGGGGLKGGASGEPPGGLSWCAAAPAPLLAVAHGTTITCCDLRRRRPPSYPLRTPPPPPSPLLPPHPSYTPTPLPQRSPPPYPHHSPNASEIKHRKRASSPPPFLALI